MAWEVLVDYSTMFPPYYLMERAFEDYRFNKSPAGLHPKNQCAIRMSVALGRCGFSLDAFPETDRVKKRRDIPVAFVQGANELANYLSKLWGKPLKFSNKKGASMLRNKKGIVYFNNCFHRSGDPEKVLRGDHIDLWNGSVYYNQLYGIPTGAEDRLSTGDMFARADQVWFFQLF